VGSLIGEIEQETGVSSEGNRLLEFGKAFAIFVSENPVFETLPAEEFLNGTPEATRLREGLKQLIRKHEITAADYRDSLDSEAWQDITPIIAMGMDALPDLDIPTLQKTADAGMPYALLLLVGNAQVVSNGVVTEEVLHKLLLRSCLSSPDQMELKLDVATACTKSPEITLDRFITELEEAGADFPYEEYINRQMLIADNTDNSVDLVGKIRSWALVTGADTVIPHLDKITDLSDDETACIYREAYNPYIGLERSVSHKVLRIIHDRFLSLEDQQQQKLITEALVFGKLVTLENLIKATQTSDTQYPVLAGVAQTVHKEFTWNFNRGNFQKCGRIRNCIKNSGLAVANEDELTLDTDQIPNSADEKVLYTSYEPTDVSVEATKFYLSEWINYKLVVLRHFMDEPTRKEKAEYLWGEPLEFSKMGDRIRFSELNNLRTETVQDIFNWVQKYLVLAINRELRYQPATTGDGGSLLGKVGEINLFEIPTNPEEIRLNLRCAEYAFANFTWKQQLGGSRWAEIAQVAQLAWSDGITEVTEQARILDIVFDLEHNNGHIFDKDPERITGTSQLKPVLDNKFRAQSYRDVLEYGKNTGLLSDKDVRTFGKAFDTLEELDHAPTRARSYE